MTVKINPVKPLTTKMLSDGLKWQKVKHYSVLSTDSKLII